ncbi:MAG TPA: 50S ribosomal protein L25 [Candidatus Taylorbacteria bacterium]|nr:MAG: 50S ribosomal protein L25 [Parcubacteria group bacterium GW2011_GWA2_47_64]KKU96987.1 MAG: 50S ribosomal protein L25 [Parcubacteria group bacterium GW2011_GWC2_48_17]HBV00887.1 50S ribosomal protein L25 [Candidatus Taylorbacteria bacterium]
MAIVLPFEKRDTKVSPNTLRRAGKIPAVFYGRKQTSTPITIAARDFEKVWKRAGEHTVVNLLGAGEDIPALLHAVDKHPVTGAPRHADFYVFEKGQKLKIKIPIEFTGVSPAVKDLGAVLVKVVHDLEVEAAPKDLPQKIQVDISSLAAFGNVITAKEIKLPEGVGLVVSPDDVIASVYEPKEEVVEEAPVDLSTIEVAKKGKEPVPGEADAAAEGAPAGSPAEPKKEEKKAAKK